MIVAILTTLAIGTVVGTLGRLVLPGRQSVSVALTVLVGVLAAAIGTAIARAFGLAATTGIDWIELGIQVALAAVGVTLVAGNRPGVR